MLEYLNRLIYEGIEFSVALDHVCFNYLLDSNERNELIKQYDNEA